MIKQSVSVPEVVDFLNSLLEIDAIAVNSLFSIRLNCNQALSAHPTVQVARLDCEGGPPVVGVAGLLNGIFGTYKNGDGAIAMRIKDGRIIGFEILQRR